MRSLATTMFLAALALLAPGCVTTGKLDEDLAAAKKELRAERDTAFATVRQERDQLVAALRNELATKAALESQVASLKQELAAAKAAADSKSAANAQAITVLDEKVVAQDEQNSAALAQLGLDIETSLRDIRTELVRTSAMATEMGKVRDKYLSTLEWESSAMEQRLSNLKKLINDLKTGGQPGGASTEKPAVPAPAGGTEAR